MDQMQLKTVITNNKQGGLISESLGPGGDSWQSGYYWKEVNDGWDLQMLVFMQSLWELNLNLVIDQWVSARKM